MFYAVQKNKLNQEIMLPLMIKMPWHAILLRLLNLGQLLSKEHRYQQVPMKTNIEYEKGNKFTSFSQVCMHSNNNSCFHVYPSEMVMDSGKLHFSNQLESTSNPELEPDNVGAANDLLLQSSSHILTTGNSNDNENTSIAQQLDTIHNSTVSDVASANVPETQSSLTEITTEFASSHDLNNDHYSQPGILHVLFMYVSNGLLSIITISVVIILLYAS